MKKLLLLFLLAFLLCGCTTPRALMRAQERMQHDINKNLQEYLVCIDDIEYIMYSSGYQGYLAPHLKANGNDSPRVVRCK